MTEYKPQTKESDDVAWLADIQELVYCGTDDIGIRFSKKTWDRLIAIARRATTKSETDGAALHAITFERKRLTDALANPDSHVNEYGAKAAICVLDRVRAAFARTPAADNGQQYITGGVAWRNR